MKKRKINRAKQVDVQCKNNGKCFCCKRSRLQQAYKELIKVKQQEKDD